MKQKSTLSQNISFIREREGLTQYDFGRLFDASRGMIDSYENDRNTPSLSFVERLSAHCKILMDTLIHVELRENPSALSGNDYAKHKAVEKSEKLAEQLISQLKKQVQEQQKIIERQTVIIENLSSK